MADKPSPSVLPLSSAPFTPIINKADSSIPISTSPPTSIAASHFRSPFPTPFSFFRHHPNSAANTMASHPQHLHRQQQSPRTHHQQSIATMTDSAAKETKKVDINSLMSPPDQILDSFNNPDAIKSTIMVAAPVSKDGLKAPGQIKHPLPMSPPVSPYSKHVSAAPAAVTTASPSHSLSDPVLYPAEEGAAPSPPQPPLFAPAELEDHQRIVDDHVRARLAAGYFGGPRREEYELALTFRSQVMTLYTSNTKGWLRKERELLKADRRAGAQRYHAIMPAKPKPMLVAAKPPRQRVDRVSKPHHGSGGSAPRVIRGGGAGLGAGAVPSKRSAARANSLTPEPSSRRAVAPNREDKDFNSLPDYCPPINSLPDKPNSLKVEWKGQPIDLSHDPHANLLHPDEVALAANLRLDCATYLTSKRRIFERRLQCLRTGKEFRKTDAQQACKIDVNKASKLWTAFDKVNWLDSRWVRPFLK